MVLKYQKEFRYTVKFQSQNCTWYGASLSISVRVTKKTRVFKGYFPEIVEKIYLQTFSSKKSENKEKYISC